METQQDLSWAATLRLIDAGLTAIEQLAWAARDAMEAGSMAFGDAHRRGRRYAQAGWTLGRMGIAYRFHRTRAAFTSRASTARAAERLHAKQARVFRERCEELGGAFLKVGQLLSARPDLVPAIWIEELASLRDAAPPAPWESIRQVLVEELGPIESRFEIFEETPVAAASIGQVHRAKTKSGQWVAVKVQRPGVGELVDTDLALMEAFIDALDDVLPVTDVAKVASEIRAAVVEELDYALERIRMQRIHDHFSGVQGVRAPEPVDSLCTPRVLTATFEEGVPITERLDVLARLRDETGEDDISGAAQALDALLETLLDAWVQMVLEAGLFQADPHPGNVLVDENDGLVLLDFGCSRDVEPETRRAYLDLMMAFLANDRDGIARALQVCGFETRSGTPDTLLEFADVMLGHLRGAFDGEPNWPTTEELLAEAARLTETAMDDPITQLPDGFVMLARVFGTLGGLFIGYKPSKLGGKTLGTLQRALIASAQAPAA